MNALNRRKNTRIKYAHIGAVGDLPRVFHDSEEMVVGNISTGGLLIIDDNEKLTSAIGEITFFELRWADLSVEAKARVVGAQFQRRHVQFIDFNPQDFVRISQLLKPGFVVSRFHRVQDDQRVLEAQELWIGPTGESLLFPALKPTMDPITYNNGKRNIFITKPNRPHYSDTNEAMTQTQLSDLLLTLANFPETTRHLKDLIEYLQSHYLERPPRAQRTGTSG